MPYRHSFFQGRRHRPALTLLIGLLSLLSGALALATPAASPPVPAAEQAQSAVQVFLPLVASTRAPAPAGAPVIEAFQLSSATGPMAAEVELRWQVRGATSLRVEPGVGDVRGAASAIVYPVATTTYTLTATNEKGSVTATATYTVDALPTPNPLTVAARFDAGRAAAANIGPAGGTVTATGTDGTRYTLSVPPEALVHTEAITLTPVAAIEGMPFAATDLRAVSIAPEGLLFIEPATLTIAPPAAPAGPQVGFAFEGAGAEFHLRGLQTAGGELQQAGGSSSQSVVAARSYGTATPNAGANLSALSSRTPSNPVDAAEHITITVEENPRPGVVTVFFQWVVPLLEAAVIDPEQVDAAAETYIRWRSSIRGDEGSFRDQISEANLLLGEALRKAGELASERCNQGRPAQGFALQRYMAYAKRFALVNTRAALEERLERCWSFRLTFDSTITRDVPHQGRDTVGMDSVVALRFDAQLGRITGTAPLVFSQLSYAYTTGQFANCTPSASKVDGVFDAAGGVRGLTLAPVSRTSPEVHAQLVYDPGDPGGETIWTCRIQGGGTLEISQELDWWRPLYEVFHLDELSPENDVVAEQQAAAGPSFRWEYQDSRTGGGGMVTEKTTLTIEHTPAR